MRRLFVPLVVALVLAVAPVGVKANTNQAAADKIAASLAEKFPGYDITVAYKNGKLTLGGQVASKDMMNRTLDHVQRIPGVRVAEIDNEMQVGRSTVARNAVAAAPRPAMAPQTTPVRQVAAQQNPQKQIQNAAAYAQITPPYGHQYPAGPQPVMNGMPMPPQMMQPMPAQMPMMPQQQQMMPGQMQQMPAQMMQQPMPGQYNQPNMPDYAWPGYAAYPNYAEVCYPKQYSPKAWPYIGPFYPYPQAPLGWRKVAMEWHDGWWWIDFDDGSANGPFSPLFRQPTRYTY